MTEDMLRNAIYDKWASYKHDVVFDENNPSVKLHHPTFGPDEILAFTEQLLTTHVTMGANVTAFEQQYAALQNTTYAVSSNSGSSANLLMVAALCNHFTPDRLQAGDEVILPALTWSTSLFPLVQYGLKPVYVDCDINTLNIDPQKIEDAIGPKTRAIMCVPIYGNPCDMDAICAIAQKHNLLLMEDSCESMGAYYNNKAVGSFGIASSFSFYYSHHITCLEGGMTVSNDANLDETMRIIRSHGWIRNIDNKEKWAKNYPHIDPKFLFVNEGYNLRITEPQAVMGLQQIQKLAGFVEKRRHNAASLKQKLAPFADIFLFQDEMAGGYHSWFGFALTLRDKATFTRDDICTFLNKHSIETRAVVAGNLAKQPVCDLFEHRIGGDLSAADIVMHRSFSIGVHQHISADAIEYMVAIITLFIEQHQHG